MKEEIDELCGDPLFQLNLAIWLAQSKPEDFSIRPVLYQSGFRIFSIGPLLALPPDTRLMVKGSKIDCNDGAKPEIILEADNRSKILIMECKRSSFGGSSSTASQARTLLLLSGPIISEVLATGVRSSAKGILGYLTRSEHSIRLEDTLSELTKEMKQMNLDTGDYGCLGIRANDTGILLEYSDKMKSLLNFQIIAPMKILTLEEGTDPRPLYLIPYDPNVEQSEAEQAFCRRILYERFLSYILSKVGPANVPCEIVVTREEIMKAATFGLFEIWDDKEAVKHMRRLLRDFMNFFKNSFKDDQRECIEYKSDRGWVFKFDNQNIHEGILTQISKFKPGEMDLSKPMQTPQLELFEE